MVSPATACESIISVPEFRGFESRSRGACTQERNRGLSRRDENHEEVVVRVTPSLRRLRDICLRLPGATETLTWGHPLFRVANKIFVGYGQEDGVERMSVKVGKGRQADLIRDPRYSIAPYVGRFGWVQFKLSGRVDWKEVAGLVLESYRLIAPRVVLAELDRDPPSRPRDARMRRANARTRAGRGRPRTRKRADTRRVD